MYRHVTNQNLNPPNQPSSLKQALAISVPRLHQAPCCIPSVTILTTLAALTLTVCLLSGCGAPRAGTARSDSSPDKSIAEEPEATEQSTEEVVFESAATIDPVELNLPDELPAETASTAASASQPLAPPPAAMPARSRSRAASTTHHRYSNSRTQAATSQSWQSVESNSEEFAAGSSQPSAALESIDQKANVPETISQPAKTNSASPKLPTQVEVFYATDRQRVASISKGDLRKVFSWAFLLGFLALITGIFGSMYQRQSVKLIAATACVGCLVLSYGGWIEWQQRARLKDNGNVWYTHDIKIPKTGANVGSTLTDEPFESLDYGRCLVTIPPNHQTGIVEAPSITKFELTEDADKHVVLEKITLSRSSEFFGHLNDRLESGSNEALIFIHGYNVSFNDAVKRTAQIAHDVKFQGAPVCYSWPSRGGLEDYTRDMANADWSVIHLQEFLASLFEQSQADKIHLIAHSMGNRVLMQALDRLALQNEQETRFGQIVLAAPDVSANDFRQRYSGVIRHMADHVTMYASSRDRALMVSAGVHGHDRAGLAGAGIVVVDGIDTIDVSHIDTSLIGHSYYGDNPELIDDLAAIILQSKPTASRTWLERIDTAANRFYWKFR